MSESPTGRTGRLARVRKAIVAGIGAAVPAGVAAGMKAAEDGTVDSTDSGAIVAAVIVAFVAVGWATWRVPNADPPTPTIARRASS